MEVCRSVARKVNLGNMDKSLQYESVDLFCSCKEDCSEAEAHEVSRKLEAICWAEIMESVKELKTKVREALK